MNGGRYVVFSNQPGPNLIRQEFGPVGKAVIAYVAREFEDRAEAEHFTDANKEKLGPLRVLDRESNEVVLLVAQGAPAGTFPPKTTLPVGPKANKIVCPES